MKYVITFTRHHSTVGLSSTFFSFSLLGASLGALSGGRVGICGLCVAYLVKAITIAVRYSGVRRQFGPSGSEEYPIIEYELQVWKKKL